eukprot:TRINITY_DN36885_c0_g1_i1.p1 TRINITY_DN36885_c0_g1~~TRINITY_DN36885_c0_g1_i1.p1  ORF type:complete len:672 (+),score=80.16 TRINITY_DN36885_c0_g1_i1:105-2120(+)
MTGCSSHQACQSRRQPSRKFPAVLTLTKALAEVTAVTTTSNVTISNKTATTTTGAPTCETAVTACACAAVDGCAWATNAAGGGNCFFFGYHSGLQLIDCFACESQSFCGDSACGPIREPCTCAVSSFDCRWDSAASSCVSRGSGSTSCAACPILNSCVEKKPEIVEQFPQNGGRQEGESLVVRFVFSTRMAWCRTSGAVVSFWCDGVARSIEVPRSRVMLDGTVLIVYATEAMGSASFRLSRVCGLVVFADMLCSEKNALLFPGIRRGDYKFMLADRVPPEVVSFEPPPGNPKIQLGGAVTLTFSEDILLGPAIPGGTLTMLDQDQSGTFSSESIDLELRPPQVSVEGRLLRIVLSEGVRVGRLYSLALPSGAVTDKAGNACAALSANEYSFRVTPKALRANANDSSSDPSVVVVALVIGFAVMVFIAIAVLMRYLYVKSMDWQSLKAQERGTQAERVSQIKVPMGTATRGGASGGGNPPAWAFPTQQGSSGLTTGRVHPGDDQSQQQEEQDQNAAGWRASSGAPAGGSYPSMGNPTARGGWGRKGVSGTTAAPAGAAFSSRPDAANGFPGPTGTRTSSGVPPEGKNPQRPAESTGRTSTPAVPGGGEELRPEVRAVQRRLQDAMDNPLPTRKKLLKELMLEYHPDKNSDPSATEVFQYVNNAKAWFLHEA